MKKLAISVFAIAMIAAGAASAEVKIKSSNEQTVEAKDYLVVTNLAGFAGAIAKQNLASNQGQVDIGGTNKQTVKGKNVIVSNVALGSNAKAIQNLSSNSSATD